MANRLVDIVAAQSARYGDRELFRFRWSKGAEWKSTSWKEFETLVGRCALSLAAIGSEPADKMAICSPNTPCILVAEFAGFRNRMASIPVYAESSQEQFDFIISNSGSKVIFVGNRKQYRLAYNYWKSGGDLKAIVVFERENTQLMPDDTISLFWNDFISVGDSRRDELSAIVEERMSDSAPDDLATLIYTSGTTGEPKGVMLAHSNYDAAIELHLKALTTVTDKDLSMAFLPMSHILEKAWCFFCITKGISIAINYDPRMIQETIHDIHPNLMCCVPRFWEKVYTAIRENVNEMGWLNRLMVRRALNVGKRRNLHYRRLDLKVPSLLEHEYRFWDRRVFSKLKRAIGIPNPNMFPTAGAPLSDRICEFMRSCGIDVVIGYGLSETTATVTCFPDYDYEIGTVGVPLPGIDVKIDDESGEILVKAPTVMKGYYDNPAANREAFTKDGYFRTGDAGRWSDSGALILTERMKDLFKTSNGKYIAPQALESRLAENKYISEVAVIGDRRKYVTALIVPNMPELMRWAERCGIRYSVADDLVSIPKIVEFVMSQVNDVQKGLAEYEKIKKITLLAHPFSIMNGEVTNTMKVRRPVVARRYASEIEKMYSEK